jgi:hypothetical protein
MRNKAVAMAAMAEAMTAGMNKMYFPQQEPNPIYFPKKHTVESYRSQQRAAKKRRKAR